MFLQQKAKDVKMVFPFLNEDISDDEKNQLEEKFWLMVLRSGEMDVNYAFQVMINYLSIMKNYSQYFALACPPTKLNRVYQSQVYLQSLQFFKYKSNSSSFRYISCSSIGINTDDEFIFTVLDNGIRIYIISMRLFVAVMRYVSLWLEKQSNY
jgi:hypothetical protein